MSHYWGFTGVSQVEIPTLARQLISTEGNLVTSTDTTDISCAPYEADQLFLELSDLVNEQFRPWYCKRFYALGADEVRKLASIARADSKSDKCRYFSKLLKNGRTALATKT